MAVKSVGRVPSRGEVFLVELDPRIEDGMVTLEEVKVLVYRPRQAAEPAE